MADLQALCDLLHTHAERGECAKVSYYYTGSDGIGLRHGAIHLDHGATAYVEHEGQPTHDAIRSITGLKFVKVASLLLGDSSPATTPHAIDVPSLLSLLQTAPAATAPPPARAAEPSAPAAPSAADVTHTSPTTTVERAALSGIDIRGEASRLLEPLFGVSAQKKLDEFSIAHPPSQHPYEFLLQCQRHAAIMLGAPKAEAMFRPLYDRLESERLQRRR